eukprot:Hpha_TRINITY_DN4348_c0_g1::TRINITY_DN4348_c0_g1_i1::g.50209::m.50209
MAGVIFAHSSASSSACASAAACSCGEVGRRGGSESTDSNRFVSFVLFPPPFPESICCALSVCARFSVDLGLLRALGSARSIRARGDRGPCPGEMDVRRGWRAVLRLVRDGGDWAAEWLTGSVCWRCLPNFKGLTLGLLRLCSVITRFGGLRFSMPSNEAPAGLPTGRRLVVPAPMLPAALRLPSIEAWLRDIVRGMSSNPAWGEVEGGPRGFLLCCSGLPRSFSVDAAGDRIDELPRLGPRFTLGERIERLSRFTVFSSASSVTVCCRLTPESLELVASNSIIDGSSGAVPCVAVQSGCFLKPTSGVGSFLSTKRSQSSPLNQFSFLILRGAARRSLGSFFSSFCISIVAAAGVLEG